MKKIFYSITNWRVCLRITFFDCWRITIHRHHHFSPDYVLISIGLIIKNGNNSYHQQKEWKHVDNNFFIWYFLKKNFELKNNIIIDSKDSIVADIIIGNDIITDINISGSFNHTIFDVNIEVSFIGKTVVFNKVKVCLRDKHTVARINIETRHQVE